MKKLIQAKATEEIRIPMDYRTIGKKAAALFSIAMIAHASYAPLAMAAIEVVDNITGNNKALGSDSGMDDTRMNVSTGGTATSTTINSGGSQYIYNGGSAASTTISDGGRQYVSAGGTATNTTISSGGYQNVVNGSATSTTISTGGTQTLYAGNATSTTINSGGRQTVSAGATATSTTVTLLGQQNVYGNALHTTISGNVTGNGAQNVYAGGTATSTTILYNGNQLIYAGGNAIHTMMSSGGMHVLGIATSTTISGGAQWVSAGGSAAYTNISGGSQVVYYGGQATYTTISGGSQVISDGGQATYTTISGGSQVISDGGQATYTTISGGSQVISDGGQATYTTISGGSQVIASGGSSISATVSAGGLQVAVAGGRMAYTNVLAGGSATFDTISAGDTLYLYGGGYASGAIATGAALNVVAYNDTAAIYDGSLDMAGKTLIFNVDSANSGSTLLTMNGGTMTINTTTNIGLTATTSMLSMDEGDDLTLVNSTNGTFNSGSYTTTGGATAFDFDLDNTTGKLLANYRGVNPGQTSSQAKAYSEGKIAGVNHIHIATEQVTGTLLDDAWNGEYGIAGVVGIGGGKIKGKTGSHVDSNAFTLAGGISNKKDLGSYTLLTAAFLEGGWGSYDSYNSFSTGDVHGSGDTSHFGAGVMGKAADKKGRYLEASLRGGKVDTDFKTGDLGAGADFDSSSAYFGMHIGIGQARQLKKGDVLDTYLKLFYTRQGSDSVTTGFGERVKFDAADSTRIRLGARYIKEFKEKTRYYAGLAWEYEFSGKQKGTINGVRIDAPEMEGSSVIFEIGMKQELSKKWEVDIGAQGLLGKREGVTGSVSFNYKF